MESLILTLTLPELLILTVKEQEQGGSLAAR